MIISSRKTFFGVLLVFLFFMSCTAVKTAVKMNEKPGKQYENVLIIALTNQYDIRATFEKELAYRLGEYYFKAKPSVSLEPNRKKMYSVDEVKQIIKESGFDGLITMKLKDIQKKSSYTRSSRYLSDPYNPYNFYNYLDTYNALYNWNYQLDKTVIIESKLYDAATGKEVYETESKMKNADSNEALAGAMAISIAQAIEKGNLLKPSK